MRPGAAITLQIVVTLIGAALLPTFGARPPVLIAYWSLAALGLLVVGGSVYKDQRRPIVYSDRQDGPVLRRHLLHLSGELGTLEKTISSALASGHWWDVRFNGLPAHEWHTARDAIAANAAELYPKVLAVYVEADQLNKVANTAAAQVEPGGRLDNGSKERLEALLPDLHAAVKATQNHSQADERPPLKHPYRTLATAVAITAVVTATTALLGPKLWSSEPEPPVYVSNPLPRDGFPHGTGISHADYPDGFHIDGVPTPTFNSYLDNEDGSRLDERPFLTARVIKPLRVPANGLINPLDVRPGDVVEISVYIRNDAGSAGNREGRGSAVASNTRVSSAWNRKSAIALALSAYIFAENAVPDIGHRDLKTISANLELRSQTEQPIKLEYVPNSAQYLQNAPGVGRHIPGRAGKYMIWSLNPVQQRMFFTGYRRNLHNNTEIDAASGLPLGSDDGYWRQTLLGRHINDRKNFYGGSGYFGYVVYRARVLAVSHAEVKKSVH